MVIDEVFPNPTVKQVMFQIRFPNLFYMESKIGDFQLKIMKEFPKSALLFRRQVVFADLGPEGKLEEIPKIDEESGKKIWRFESDKNYRLSVLTNSLDITSEYHKTYNGDNPNKFRDIIEFVLNRFFEVSSIPIINRIGLRYIDECPLPSKDNETLKSYYNSIFPIDRFNIADVDEMFFRTVTKKNNFNIIYAETLQKIKDEYKLNLDFDGFALNILSEDCLRVTDELHRLISEEYEKTIKEPVYNYMRRRVEGTGN
jgi:uncharacterized protein (TIGR04255 family)